jgi:hypothetical protein
LQGKTSKFAGTKIQKIVLEKKHFQITISWFWLPLNIPWGKMMTI